MSNKATLVAQYIINRCSVNGNPITNSQLQKILYFSQREFLQKFGEPLFSDKIEAWKYGVVISSTNYVYCGYGLGHITSKYNEDIFLDIKLTKEQFDILNALIDNLSNENEWDLIEKCCLPNGAWHQVYKDGEGEFMIIDIERIRQGF